MHTDLEIRNALDQNELVMYYHPLKNSNTNEILSAEALLRWKHPKLGVISASEVLAYAKRSGLMAELCRWTIVEVCRQQREWLEKGFQIMPVSVNIPSSLLNDSQIVGVFVETLTKFALESKYIQIEVTESDAIIDFLGATATLNLLRGIGIKVAIDDFGTEYSTLSYLLLPIDILKIDKSFVDGIGVDQKSEEIIRAVISLARSLKLVVVAEGVETGHQVRFLSNEGCDNIQGFYFYKPMNPEDIVELILCKEGNTI